MSTCPLAEICGGCRYRDMEENAYRELKKRHFATALKALGDISFRLNQPVFIPDGTRRRAVFNFAYRQQKLLLGFNEAASHRIADIEACPLLTPALNGILPLIRRLLEALCREPFTLKKGKKVFTATITGGDVFVCEAANGIDIVLEYDAPLELNHRLIISEICRTDDRIIRLSHRRKTMDDAETVIEKAKPFIKAGRYDVIIPAGTFLQPSAAGQEALGNLVMQYMQGVKGQVADLFCGVGTFSYLLADLPGVSITAVDSSPALLRGFQESVNRNRMPNVAIKRQNLFKYPLTAAELENFSAVVFDPPRAGAVAQCGELAAAVVKPPVVVAVSCNPATFVNDAATLLSGGYILREITMVDQFVYSNHSELVAFFTK